MVNLITGPRGSGKTQQMIDLANEKVKTSSGNVVFIKRSNKDTYSVDFNIRVIRMADYPDILTLEEFVGFLYGMAAGNHDIQAVFIDSILKQANITLESLPSFIQKLIKISSENNIDFYLWNVPFSDILIQLKSPVGSFCCIWQLKSPSESLFYKILRWTFFIRRLLLNSVLADYFGSPVRERTVFAFSPSLYSTVTSSPTL